MNLVRTFGVLAPNSSMRQQVIQTAGPSPALFERLAGAARCMGLETVQEVGERIEATAGARGSPAEKEADKHAPPEQEDAAVDMRQDDQAGQPEAPRRRASYLWAMLIARIDEALPLLCTRCGQPMKLIAFILEPAAVSKILDSLGEPTRPPPLSPARGPPQMDLDLDLVSQVPPWE